MAIQSRCQDVIMPWQVTALASDISALASLGKYDFDTRRRLVQSCKERIDALSLTNTARREVERLVRHAAHCA